MTIVAAPGGGNPLATTVTGGATKLLTEGQQEFAGQMAVDTGLDPNVIAAWLLSEESGSAAQTYQQGAGQSGPSWNNWLNIGRNGNPAAVPHASINGLNDSIWNDPISAANASVAWLEGKPGAVPGYGSPPSSIQQIVSSANDPISQQIAALQSSGWVTGHSDQISYPDLPTVYQEVIGAGALQQTQGTSAAQVPNPLAQGTPNSITQTAQNLNAQSPTPGTTPASSSSTSSSGGGLGSSLKYGAVFVALIAAGAVLIILGLARASNKGQPRLVPVPA